MTSLSQRVVERAARRLDRGAAPAAAAPATAAATVDGGGTSRRSFLVRTAMVGSALAVAPARFLLRPGTAYGAITSVCGPDANCTAGGFSVFCCTINGGLNQCPSGSIPGGWWRAGVGSSWCCGADRYYIDCQATCPPGCGCGGTPFCPGCQACTPECYNGPSCDQRNVCQVQFRYGQCNEQIGCTGNVLCRMVSCTPPWQIPALNCASGPDLTDPATAEQSAPCLQAASWTGGAFPISSAVAGGAPAVAQVAGSARIDLFARANSAQIEWSSNNGSGAWTAWVSLGAPPVGFFGGPSAVTWGSGDLNVFVWGGDNRLWQTFSSNGGQSWSGWFKPVGDDGVLASEPAVCSWGPGRVDVFVIGTNGAVYHRWYDGGWNSAWEYRGAPPAALQYNALTATSWAPGRVDVFAAAGTRLWQTFYDGQWNGWAQPPGTETGISLSAPSSTSWGPDHLAVFVQGTDGGLWWVIWFQNYWSGWERIGLSSDVFEDAPAAGSSGCQQMDVFVLGSAGHIREYLYSG